MPDETTQNAASVSEGLTVYRVVVDVLATPKQSMGLAVAVAKAVDFNHLGAITVTPVETAMEADRIAADFADIPFDDHEARKLALAYQHLRGVNRWLRDDIDVKCETIARLEADRA